MLYDLSLFKHPKTILSIKLLKQINKPSNLETQRTARTNRPCSESSHPCLPGAALGVLKREL